MKVPRTKGDRGTWERMIARYLTANKIPLTWDHIHQKFNGIAGFTFKRIAPKRARVLPAETWANMPEYWRDRQDLPNMIVIVTNRTYGDDLEDSLVVMRLGTLTPILAQYINNDRERYIHAPHNHG